MNPAALEPPGEVTVDLTVFGSNLVHPTSDVILGAELPAGFLLTGIASDDGWTCAPDPTTVQCGRSAHFGDSASSRLSLTLGVTPGAAVGTTPLVFAASTPGEPADRLGDNQSAVDVQIDGPPPAGIALRLWQYGDAGEAALTDGAPIEVLPGTSGAVGLDAINDGSSPIAAGTALVLTATLPPGTVVTTTTDLGEPSWDCGPGGGVGSLLDRLFRLARMLDPGQGDETLRCTFTVATPIPLDASLPRLRAELALPAGFAPGPVDVPVALAAQDPATSPDLSSALDIPLVVIDPAAAADAGPGLSVVATVGRVPRFQGRTGELTIEVQNTGSDRVSRAEVGIDLPEGVSASRPLPGGCSTFAAGLRGFDLICTTGTDVGPGEWFDPIVVGVEAGARPGPVLRLWSILDRLLGSPVGGGPSAPPVRGGPAHIHVDPSGEGEAVDTTVELPVLAPLVARASASPTEVHNQAFGGRQPMVLLDGRASEAVGASHVWRQVPAGGEPLVVFDRAAPGATQVESSTATFAAPVVEATTVLHFALDVTDGFTTSTATVEVTVEPVPVAADGGSTGWEDQADNTRPAAARFPSPAPLATIAFATAAPPPWWTWTTDPSVHRYFEYVALGSRLTLLDNGTYEFAQPDNPPQTEEVRHEWLLCDEDPPGSYDPVACDVIGTEESVVPREADRIAVLRMIVTGQRLDESFETVREFDLGRVAIDRATPRNLEGPRILGVPVLGQVLTSDTGTWNLEFEIETQWQRCPGENIGCETVAVGPTYTVNADDFHHYLRAVVTSFALDGEGRVVRSTSGSAISDVVGPVPEPDLVVTTDLPGGSTSVPNSAEITVNAVADGGDGDVTLEWEQTAGPDVLGGPVAGGTLQITTPATGGGDLRFVVTATDSFGITATAAIIVTFGEVAVPGLLCQMAGEAGAAGSDPVTFSLGSAMVLTFAGATTTPGTCSESTTLDMTGATLDLFEWLRVVDLDVHVDADGIDLDGGTLTAPGDAQLAGMDFRVVTTGLHIPFSLDGADLTVAGAVIADSLTFLDLPGGWEAAAKLAFSSSAEGQVLGLAAVAWDAGGGAAEAVPDDLPVPPEGASKLTVDGSASTDRSLSLSLTSTGLVEIQGAGIDFAGTLTRAADGAFDIAVGGSLAGPVGVGPGVTLESATLAWDGSVFSGSGALSITADGGVLLVAATFDFADPRSYAATLSIDPGAGDPSWTPIDGFTIGSPTVAGRLAREGGTTTFDLEIGAASVSLAPEVVLSDLLFEVHSVCEGPCATELSATGAVTVSIDDPPTTVEVAGTLDLATGAFSLNAAIAELRPFDGLVVESVTLSMTGGDGEATEISLQGNAVVFDVPVEVVIELSDAGVIVSVSLGTWDPAPGSPKFDQARIVYSTYEATILVGSDEVPLPARSIYLAATTGVPSWFADLIGFNPGGATVAGLVDLTTADFDLQISFDLPADTELFAVGGVAHRLDGVSFHVVSAGGFVTSSLGAGGELRLPGFDAATPPSQVPVDFAATYQPGPGGGLAGTLTVEGDWADAFGVPGLIVRDLTAGVSIGAGIQVQLAGTVVLPGAWVEPMGLVAGTPIVLVASVGGPNACFSMEVGQAGATVPVVDFGNAGAVTARHLSIVVAPTGCTVGPHTLVPGASLLFDGAVLGTDVTVNATVRPAPFVLDATVTIGDISVDGFQLRSAEFHILLSAVEREISFAADATVFGVEASVRGEFAKTPTGTTVDLQGTFSSPDLGGLSIDRLLITLHLEQQAGLVTIDLAAEADIAVLGVPQHVALAFTIVNGRIESASGDASILIPIDHVTITGTGHFELQRGEFPTVSIDGTMDVDGHSLTQVSAHLTGAGLDLQARLGTALGLSSPPTLAGTIVWASDGGSTTTIENQNGDEVEASQGDFRFAARNLGLGIRGFSMSAAVSIGYVDGVFWADLAASTNIAGKVEVAGSFASNGDFSLTGSAAIKLNGFSLPSGSFTVARSGGSLDIRAAIRWSVPKLAAVTFEGSFSRTGVYGMSYDLRGNGAVTPGGYNFGTGSFRIWRQVGLSEGGVEVAVTLDVPGFARTANKIAVYTNGNLFLDASMRMEGTIGRVLGNPTALVHYHNKPGQNSLTIDVSARDALGLPGSVHVTGSISNGNYLDFKATAGMYKTGSKKIYAPFYICRAEYRLSASFSGTIRGLANLLFISASANLGAWGKCGRISGGIGGEFAFTYLPPAKFSVKVKLKVNYGVGTWKPTVFSYST